MSVSEISMMLSLILLMNIMIIINILREQVAEWMASKKLIKINLEETNLSFLIRCFMRVVLFVVSIFVTNLTVSLFIRSNLSIQQVTSLVLLITIGLVIYFWRIENQKINSEG